MISTGIVRNLDDLGRISIPKEIRQLLSIKEIMISLHEEVGKQYLILEKHSSGCVFCDSKENTIEYMGKKVCHLCINQM